MRKIRILLLLSFTVAAFAQSKRPLNHRDYDGWNSIQSQALSRDGKFLAYGLFPEDGDGFLVVKNLSTGKEIRENAGAIPSTPDNTNFEAPAEGPAGSARSIRIVFTHDNRFVVASAFAGKAETEKAKKDGKRADEMPRGGMIVVDLANLSATRVPDVASFQVPELGDSFVAYLKGPKAGSAPAATENNQDGEDQRGGRGGARTAGGRGRKQYGSDLMLRDLRTSKERSFEDALEYSISKDARSLVYAVSSKKEESNGVYSVAPGSDAGPASLLSGKGRYTKFTWDIAQKELAFLSDRDDADGKPAKFKA
jgi:hypothetical protein